ncbi:MAG TPA: hypothetical protein VNC50_13540, partial [Planctomycetia bacterium]|nr:hypothetical protein [Planctomycetia bacterium]
RRQYIAAGRRPPPRDEAVSAWDAAPDGLARSNRPNSPAPLELGEPIAISPRLAARPDRGRDY